MSSDMIMPEMRVRSHRRGNGRTWSDDCPRLLKTKKSEECVEKEVVKRNSGNTGIRRHWFANGFTPSLGFTQSRNEC